MKAAKSGTSDLPQGNETVSASAAETGASATIPRRKRKGWKPLIAKLTLLGGSCVVALLFGEVLVRVLRPGFPGFRIPQIVHQTEPGLGFSMTPSQKGYTFAEPVSVNADGCRGPEIRDRADVSLRVICLGDSITFGVGVGDDAVYARLLENGMQTESSGPQSEVINAAVQRYFTYQEIDWLKERGLALDPDVVILGVYSNDLGIRPEGDYVKTYEKERERAATSLRSRLPWVYLAIKNSALIETIKTTVLTSGNADTNNQALFEGRPTPWAEKRWTAKRKELETYKQLSEEHGFRTLVLALPNRYQIVEEFPSAEYPARLHQICNDLGLASVDFVPEFKSSLQDGKDPYLPWDNHLSPVGHRIIAEKVLPYLQSADAE